MRFFLSLLAVVVFIVVVIVIVATHNSHPAAPKPINLDNYNYAGTSVSQITTGELTGEENRQAIEITVSDNQKSIYILDGYEQNIASSQTFGNTSAAYGVFLGALQDQGFAISRKTTEVNMFGICPLGNTYQYELNSNGNTVFNLWSTSCALTDGTFDGLGSTIRQLFDLQIPDYNTFVQSLNSLNTSDIND